MSPRPTPRSLSAVLAGLLVCTLTLSMVGRAHAETPTKDVPADIGSGSADGIIVRLSTAPLSTSPQARRIGPRVGSSGVNFKNARFRLTQQRTALKSWMRVHAPKARVTHEYDYALNGMAIRLNGTNAAIFATAPGVAAVSRQVKVTRASVDPELQLIDAPAGWTSAGASSVPGNPSTWAGHGIKVGVIDSGIDVTHPCFADVGFPATAQLGDRRFTNNKVIVARVFNSNSQFTAQGIDPHGTHVAGTVGCNLHRPASVEGVTVPYTPSGVAPGVQLGNYNVFPGDVEEATSADVIAAMNAAAADGMNVLNLSLGSQAFNGTDAYTAVVANLDQAGVVVAASQGNDGPNYGTASSPGNAREALTSGASSVGHFIGTPIVTSSATVAVAAMGEFAPLTANLAAPLELVTTPRGRLSEACTPLSERQLAGRIAVISRGSCSFGTKVARAGAAGAVAVIVVNDTAGDPTPMASDPVWPATIPAVMVAQSDEAALRKVASQLVTISAGHAYSLTGNHDILMWFSSWGPVTGSYAAKPDLVSPGGSILSSLPQALCTGKPNATTFGCWGMMSGTSMASPHTAGMAAVVKAAHPRWTAAQVRSALANTASIDGVKQTTDITAVEHDVLKVGNGLANLDAAVNATLAISETTISFGLVTKERTRRQTVTVTNLTDASITVPVSVERANTTGFTVNVGSVTLPAHGSAQVNVYATLPSDADNFNQAHLVFGDRAHVVMFAYTR